MIISPLDLHCVSIKVAYVHENAASHPLVGTVEKRGTPFHPLNFCITTFLHLKYANLHA